MEFDLSNVINVILGLIVTFLGWRWTAAKKALKEIAELCFTTDKALEDDKLTQKETQDIIREAQEAVAAIKAVISRTATVSKKPPPIPKRS